MGLLLVASLSNKTQDKSVELAATSVLVTGPIGALVGLLLGVFTGTRSRSGDSGK